MSGPDSCPTVKIVAEHTRGNTLGYREINECDFNADEHELFEGEEESADELAARLAEENRPRDDSGLYLDGPTESEYRKAGYTGAYPPSGYAVKAEAVVEPVAETTKPDGWGNAPGA